jgi:HSP20 family protein
MSELRRMEEMMNRLWRGSGGLRESEGVEGWSLAVDVVQEGDNIVVRASGPGIKPEDIQVTIDEGVLTIKGETSTESETKQANYLLRERRSGSFYRSLRLPDTVDPEKAQSRYDHGVLTLTFPKLESKKARQIKIEVAR